MSTQTKVEQRLSAVEDRLDRLEDLLVGISQKLDHKPRQTEINEEKGEALKDWVTDYVSMRLQQLVPETCDHPAEANPARDPFSAIPPHDVLKRSSIASSVYPSRLFARWLCSESPRMRETPR